MNGMNDKTVLTIAQLIEQLQRIQAEHGDLPVVGACDDREFYFTEVLFEPAYVATSLRYNYDGTYTEDKHPWPDRVGLE